MTDTNRAHAPGPAGETKEERRRRMAEHQVGPEDEVRKVPERPPTAPSPKASAPEAHGATHSPGPRRREYP